jgi:hypothetical protein
MAEESGFHSVCYTCSVEHYAASYPEAADFFAEHADEGHEVETVNLDNRESLSLET